MNKIKKFFAMLFISIIIFMVAFAITSLLNVIEHFSPILFMVIGVIQLLFAGYYFGNKFNK